jgi:hypothetical protein
MLIRIGSILGLPLMIFAAELNFVASVNKTEVAIGEPLLLTLSVEGEDIGQVPSPQIPDLPDFDIGSTSTSQSTNIQMVGGKVIQRQFFNFIYTLYPRELGKSVIGSCKLEFRNETYNTQPIEINVVKGSTQSNQPSQQSSPVPEVPGAAIDDNLKLLVTVSRKNIYQGEPVVVEYSLYTRLRLADINLSEAPTFSGFWVEPIFDAQRVEVQRKTVAGKIYDVSLLKKLALFPMTTGRLLIAPMKLNVAVVQSPRDFFDFFGTTKSVPLASDAVYIDVMPLPTEGRPEEFTGGVGKFTIAASLDTTSSAAAEPINLTVRISGTGNIKLIEKPVIPSIPGVKILEPEVKENTQYVDGSIRGFKEFCFPLIPQTDGEHVVPSIILAYFNPSDNSYHTVDTEKLKFTATQTASTLEIAQTGGLKVIGTDIKYLKPSVSALKNQRLSVGAWLISLYVLSVAAVCISVVYRRHRSRLLSDRAYARKLRSSRLVRKRLKEAEQHLMKGNKKEFHATLSKVMLGYIGDRYNLDVGSMTNEDIEQELRRRDVGDGLINRLHNLLTQCDMRFSPGMKYEDPKVLLQTVRELLAEL